MQIELKVTKNIRDMYLKSLSSLTNELEEMRCSLKSGTLSDEEVAEYNSIKRQRDLKIRHNNKNMASLHTPEFIEKAGNYLSKYDYDKRDLMTMFGVFIRQYLREGADPEVKSPDCCFTPTETWEEAKNISQGLGGKLEHHILTLYIPKLGKIYILVENLEEITKEDYIGGRYGTRREYYNKMRDIQIKVYSRKRKDILFNIGNTIKLDEVEYEQLVSEIGELHND